MINLATKNKIGNKEYSFEELVPLLTIAVTLLRGDLESLSPELKEKWQSQPFDLRASCIVYAIELLNEVKSLKVKNFSIEGRGDKNG